jgi:hypothetical protein
MIDYFAIAVTHALIALACLRLLMRDDLDRDPPPAAQPDAPARSCGSQRQICRQNEEARGA